MQTSLKRTRTNSPPDRNRPLLGLIGDDVVDDTFAGAPRACRPRGGEMLAGRKGCAESPQNQPRPSVNPPTGKASCIPMRNLSSHNRRNEREQRKEASLYKPPQRAGLVGQVSKDVAKTRGNTQGYQGTYLFLYHRAPPPNSSRPRSRPS